MPPSQCLFMRLLKIALVPLWSLNSSPTKAPKTAIMQMTYLSGLYTNSAPPRGLPKWLTSLCTTMKSNPMWDAVGLAWGKETNQLNTSEARLSRSPSWEVWKLGCMPVSPLCHLPSKTARLMVKEKSWGQTGIGSLGQVQDIWHT